MMDIDFLQAFAQANNFDLTTPLSNRQVTNLAEHWLPRVFFHEKEKYHPIGLDEVIEMVEEYFSELPAESKETWRVRRWVREGSAAVSKLFDPPLVTVPTGVANASPSGGSTPRIVETVRVISDEVPVQEAFEDPDVSDDARVTHGATDRRSAQFFGSVVTISGGPNPAPDDPLVPRAVGEDGRPRLSVMVSYKNLLETLEYNLLTQADDDYPPDALRTGFDVESLLISEASSSVQMSVEARRDLLRSLIAAHKNNEPRPQLPTGVKLNEGAWDALTRYSFLEYYLFYAYNDFDRYQETLFENEHEGDDEGFCLVFDRNVINAAFLSPDPDTLLTVPPHSIITSVHEEFQDADEYRLIPTPATPAASPEELKEQLDLTVWVAGGSHATYLSQGTHPLVDFGDFLGWINENAPWLWLAPVLVLNLAIIYLMLEHYFDTEDFTSDDGIHTGSQPPQNGAPDPTFASSRIVVLPMSNGDHIYQDRSLLRLAAFPGPWGAHDGFIDKSPPFIPKTGRYFRKLLRYVG
jgi:hypothetical protein